MEPSALPSLTAISTARANLIRSLPSTGLGESSTSEHINYHITPGLNNSSLSPTYYGFVTGGVTPAALSADHIVSKYDQNVQVHLPNDTIATDVEDAALRMVCDLARVFPDDFTHRTFTTGATASNVLGLACGREYIIAERARRLGKGKAEDGSCSVAESGLMKAMREVEIDEIQILTTVPHSSLRKAAAIVGLGRSSIIDVGKSDAPHRFDFEKLSLALQRPRTASIVAVSCAEVNTGFFATSGTDMQRIRELCDAHGAWVHVDAAFGLQARILPEDDAEFARIVDGVRDIHLADSITGDAHKLLNVPYDCGIFLSRHLSTGISVFQNPNAAYLSSASSSAASIPSPLNIGIENSRRFRALPVYSTLTAYGLSGYRDILQRQITLARGIARFILHEARLELLPSTAATSYNKGKEEAARASATSDTETKPGIENKIKAAYKDKGEGEVEVEGEEDMLSHIFIIVLFRARHPHLNSQLVSRINASREIYVSGTTWEGMPATRFAVANWQVDVQRDLQRIKDVVLRASRVD